MNIYKKARLEARIRLGEKISMKNVAEALGINISTVSNWERGRSIPKATMLVGLQKLYQCPIEDLIPKE